MGDDKPIASRRPLKSRSTRWAAIITRGALAAGLTANQVSLIGVVVAGLGAWAIVEAPSRPWLFLVGAMCVQLRLLANLVDGLVAVEGGRGGPTGAIWNEFPDRIEDSLFLVAVGYAADPLSGLFLGLTAALLAATCAYVRLLGATLGQPQDFGGPMAKPHRMAALTVGLVAAFIDHQLTGDPYGSPWLMLTLAIIAGGTILSIGLRLVRLSKALRG